MSVKCLFKTGHVPAATQLKSFLVSTGGVFTFMNLEFPDFGTEVHGPAAQRGVRLCPC